MPKKTKREKIIADYRKKLQLIEAKSLQSLSPITKQQHSGASYKIAPQPSSVSHKQATLALDEKELRSITRDLIKTVALAGIAIAGELALYWFWK